MTFSQISPKGRGSVARNVAGGLVVAVCLGALGACETDAPTSAAVTVESASFAKGGPGGGGGGGGTTAPTVGSVLPTAAVQDTTVAVNIYGTGFTNGAAATWSLAGDTTKVHVKSTKFVSGTQLVAQVVVPATAPLGSYDVVVLLIGGKKGVGAELFEVVLGDPAATYRFPLADASLNIKSDGAFSDGTYSVYANGVCGVEAKIFATAELSNSGDATLGTSGPRSKDRSCSVYPRRFTVVFPDGFTETTASFSNLREIANTTYAIPVDSTVKRAFHMGVATSARCEGVVWSAIRTGTPIPGDSVLVTRTGVDTWHVQSQPAPNNRAYCWPNGPAYHMSVEFTVTASRPLP